MKFAVERGKRCLGAIQPGNIWITNEKTVPVDGERACSAGRETILQSQVAVSTKRRPKKGLPPGWSESDTGDVYGDTTAIGLDTHRQEMQERDVLEKQVPNVL
ncbi:MAG: hypothetical protein K5657_10420 [Desulfovibrio sp.]|nr:hypothetical protein [Desulfovibrio sp.]